MISSIELMERTGIPRGILNNYVGMGILERPELLAAVDGEPGGGSMCFFPESAVEAIEQAQQLKAEGLSMSEIAKQMASLEEQPSSASDSAWPVEKLQPAAQKPLETLEKSVSAAEKLASPVERSAPPVETPSTPVAIETSEAPAAPEAPVNLEATAASVTLESTEAPEAPSTPSITEKSSPKAKMRGFETENPSNLSVDLSVDNIPGPAFMVNNNFELTWWNEKAADTFFELDDVVDRDIAARNIFHLLLNREQAHSLVNFPQMLGITMSAAKKRMSLKAVSRVYPLLEPEDVQLMSKLFESVEAIGDEDIMHHIFDINDEQGKEKTHTLYVCFFGEGVFFSFLPTDEDSTALIELLSQRSQVINQILKKRRPFLTNLVTMVADLQGSMKICSELPAEEYFELINEIWQAAEPIFRRYNATHGKHVGDGMVYYFLPQPESDYITNALYCAHELRELMRGITREWNVRKNWGHELKLNIGLNEGQEWFGTYHAGNHVEFTVLGDTINHASRLSDFARDGGIWATKGMLSKLKREARQTVRYGVHRPGANEQKILSPDLFAQVSNLIDLEEGKNFKFRDIAALPVAEVVDVIIPREKT